MGRSASLALEMRMVTAHAARRAILRLGERNDAVTPAKKRETAVIRRTRTTERGDLGTSTSDEGGGSTPESGSVTSCDLRIAGHGRRTSVQKHHDKPSQPAHCHPLSPAMA